MKHRITYLSWLSFVGTNFFFSDSLDLDREDDLFLLDELDDDEEESLALFFLFLSLRPT